MTGHFHWIKATLFFLVYYLAVGAVWYVVEVKVSPLVASAALCLMAIPVLWLPSRLCLKSFTISSALVLGIFWSAWAILLDVVLWVEPLGILSGPLRINFSADYFYMERYFPFMFITYGAVFVTPILYVSIRHRGAPTQS
jgi:hypothetical protein